LTSLERRWCSNEAKTQNPLKFAGVPQTGKTILAVVGTCEEILLFMVALWNRADHYIFALWFLLLCSFFFLSSPNLSRRRLDVCHTSTHGVALMRIEDAGLKRAARGSLQMQDAKKSTNIAIWALSHKFVGLYLCN